MSRTSARKLKRNKKPSLPVSKLADPDDPGNDPGNCDMKNLLKDRALPTCTTVQGSQNQWQTGFSMMVVNKKNNIKDDLSDPVIGVSGCN